MANKMRSRKQTRSRDKHGRLYFYNLFLTADCLSRKASLIILLGVDCLTMQHLPESADSPR